jgi:ABC-type antimicrobial peptide transport system permease subunit
MSTGWLVLILCRRNLLRRPGGAAMLLVAISTATLTLSLALALGTGAGTRWDRIVTGTGAADVVATAEQAAALTPLTTAAGVTGSVGPYPVLEVPAQLGGQSVRLRVVGRDTLATLIDHPLLTAGSADLSGAGIVLDHNVAAGAGLRVGGTVRIGNSTLTVRGTALSAAQPPFPAQGPGLAWVSLPTIERLAAAASAADVAGSASPAGRLGYVLELRLSAAADPAGFVAARHADPDRLTLQTARDIRADVTVVLRVVSELVLTASGLLCLLAGCGVAVLLAAQLGARMRQVGALQAIGATPGQVVLVTVVEHLAVAVLAAGVGLAAGIPLAAWFGHRASAWLGLPDASGLSWPGALAVLAVAVGAVLLASAVPAWRALRKAPFAAAGVSQPRRASRLSRLAVAVYLPLPAVLAVRSLARRPARAALTVCSFAVAVSMGTVGLILDAVARHLEALPGEPADQLVDGANRALLAQIHLLVGLLAALFAVLGLVNLLLVSAVAARDAARDQATLRAVGLTPGQAVASLTVAQMITAVVGTALGIPAGTALFRAFSSGEGTPDPGAPSALTPTGTVLLAATALVFAGLLAAIPAGAAGRRPPGPPMRADS